MKTATQAGWHFLGGYKNSRRLGAPLIYWFWKMTDNNNYHELWNLPPRERSQRRQNVPVEGEDVITQDELCELLRLQQQRDRHTQLWKSIRRRLLDGAEVAPGLHHVRIETREMIRFSQQVFLQLYGNDWVQEQREKITPEIRQEMVVEYRGISDPLGE